MAQTFIYGSSLPEYLCSGHNFHGKYEYVPLESMVKAVEVIVKIIELYSAKYKDKRYNVIGYKGHKLFMPYFIKSTFGQDFFVAEKREIIQS